MECAACNGAHRAHPCGKATRKRPAAAAGGGSGAGGGGPSKRGRKVPEAEAKARRAIPELTEVDELLEENEQLIVDIDKHQAQKKRQKEGLEQAEKLIQQLNRNTHQVVALYKNLSAGAAKALLKGKG